VFTVRNSRGRRYVRGDYLSAADEISLTVTEYTVGGITRHVGSLGS